jgi:hypothetical protein
MRTASILLALVVVLCFVRDAGAKSYCIWIAGNRFGLDDVEWAKGTAQSSTAYLGPLGAHHVPLTATQGLAGFCLIMIVLIAVLVVATFRWKLRQPSRL